MNLLVVDDYPANRKLLRASLEAYGHTVRESANGLEALQVLEREPTDGVISDILMPGMDGFRLCREIRQREVLRATPVVLYTSTYNSESDRRLAEAVGADAYLLKPALTSVLLTAIEDARALGCRRDGPAETAVSDVDVLERYSATLVRKLESRNEELQESVAELARAHDQIVELNRNLELRVAQRTTALEAANRELEAFCRSVSFDLLVPTRNIAGYAQCLESSSGVLADANAQEWVGRIRTSSRQMERQIQALLEFARMGRVALRLEEIELETLLEEALGFLAADVEGRNIEWRRNRLPYVHGDAALLRQVLIQLLSNALKFSRTRDRAVIEIGCRPGRADEVVVYIKDNGVGFDVRRAQDLFGIFKRLHDSDEYTGDGIGLASSQRIITRHGGSIWADGTPNGGATFSFSLRRV